jgi:hypothetical protein
MDIGLRQVPALAGSYAMFGKRPFSAHRCHQLILKRDQILRMARLDGKQLGDSAAKGLHGTERHIQLGLSVEA